MKTLIKSFSLLISLTGLLLFQSCRQDTPDISETYPLIVNVDISGKSGQATRAIRTKLGDQWSYEAGQSFQKGDMIGFYASSGNASGGNDGNQPFVNELLRFDGTKFESPEYGPVFSPTYLNGADIYMYFQYDENVGTTGINLRTKPSEDNDTLRCIDFLSANTITALGENTALYGSLQHGFSELIIMRGEGFDAPPDGKWMINVVMSEPVTHLKIDYSEDPLSFAPKLTYDEASTGLSDEQARRWTAWRGYNYGITENNDPEGEPAWYVIVPSLNSKYSTVEFIELYDNEGYLQRVSSLKLHDNSKNVQPSWRYPIKIAMKELVPTVNPFPILPWEEEINLTDERTRGITDITEFSNWVKDYNAYILDSDNSTKQDALLNYGDRYIDSEGNISWHFYLLNNLDFSTYKALPYEGKDGETIQPADNVIIPEFHDILDGKSTNIVNGQFANYQILNLGKTFIGTLSLREKDNKCSITNIDFIDPDIRYPNDNTTSVGIIANSMSYSSVINCNIITGTLMNAGGPAGMITGSMTGGSLENCVLSGFINYLKTSTMENAKNIVGEDPVGAEIKNVNAAAVVPS